VITYKPLVVNGKEMMERFSSDGCKDIWEREIGSLLHKINSSGQQFVDGFICQ